MDKKISIVIASIVSGIIIISLAVTFTENEIEPEEGEWRVYEEIPSIFTVLVSKENYERLFTEEQPDSARLQLKPENDLIYLEVRDSVIIQNTVVVFPLFTAAAYEKPGFYDYYIQDCDESCLTKELKDRDEYRLHYNISGMAVQVLNLLAYKFITDLELHKNPEILAEFDKVILLHNEYVTKAEFEAITQHPNVIYLYPNALYAEVEYNESDNTIKLIRGHNYPDPKIKNGFDWEFDNTHPFEYDTECNDWKFNEIDNGYMLNCYPEIRILNDVKLLKQIKFIDIVNKE